MGQISSSLHKHYRSSVPIQISTQSLAYRPRIFTQGSNHRLTCKYWKSTFLTMELNLTKIILCWQLCHRGWTCQKPFPYLHKNITLGASSAKSIPAISSQTKTKTLLKTSSISVYLGIHRMLSWIRLAETMTVS